MNKDVIYIDVDDDVTAIIGKIKKAEEKIVALVPPKRTGTLQSAVNLRLLDRMAKAEKKRLVLITNNQALVGLAAAAKIPVAKNLQSKPEIAEIPALAVDDDDDIIDGAELPVGDHARTVKTAVGVGAAAGVASVAAESRSQAIEETNLDIDDENSVSPGVSAGYVAPHAADQAAKTAAGGAALARGAAAAKGKKHPKIPDFNSFRKKLFFGAIGGAALVALLIWMFVFAPAATIIITATTTPQPISSSVKLGGTAATDFKAGVVSSVSQQDKQDVSIEFTATGTGTVGDKATGSVVFKNCEDSAAISIPAGTTVSYGSKSYVTQTAVSVPGGTGSFFGCTTPGTSSAVTIIASDIGDSFNVASGTTFSVSGHSNASAAYMRAVASTDISGGSSRQVTTVSADDIERAKGQLLGQSTDTVKAALTKKFASGTVAIDSSFTVERGDATASPSEGQEASNGKAKLTIPTTFSMQGVARSDIQTYLKASIGAKIDASTQKIYDDGSSKATLSNFRKDGDTLYATVNATGRVGPKIDESTVKNGAKGKIYGEVQQSLQAQEGISAVDVQFSYFWVRTVPNDTNKIAVEFKVTDDN